jgi:hypothetical protein
MNEKPLEWDRRFRKLIRSCAIIGFVLAPVSGLIAVLYGPLGTKGPAIGDAFFAVLLTVPYPLLLFILMAFVFRWTWERTSQMSGDRIRAIYQAAVGICTGASIAMTYSIVSLYLGFFEVPESFLVLVMPHAMIMLLLPYTILGAVVGGIVFRVAGWPR